MFATRRITLCVRNYSTCVVRDVSIDVDEFGFIQQFWTSYCCTFSSSLWDCFNCCTIVNVIDFDIVYRFLDSSRWGYPNSFFCVRIDILGNVGYFHFDGLDLDFVERKFFVICKLRLCVRAMRRSMKLKLQVTDYYHRPRAMLAVFVHEMCFQMLIPFMSWLKFSFANDTEVTRIGLNWKSER